MKKAIRSLVRHLGYDLVPADADPLLAALREAYLDIHFNPGKPEVAAARLSQVAALGHLRELLLRHAFDLVVDVCAHRGDAALGLRRLGYDGPILSFEPAPESRAILERLAAGDPRWTIRASAVAAAHGRARFHLRRESQINSLQPCSDAGRQSFGAAAEVLDEIEIETVRLDEVLAEPAFAGYRRIFLKTDAQGADHSVLSGAESAPPRSSVNSIPSRSIAIRLPRQKSPRFSKLTVLC